MDGSPKTLFNVVGSTSDPESSIYNQIIDCITTNDVKQVYIVKCKRARECSTDEFEAIKKVKHSTQIQIYDKQQYGINIMEYSWKQMLLVMNTHSSNNKIPWGIIRYLSLVIYPQTYIFMQFLTIQMDMYLSALKIMILGLG